MKTYGKQRGYLLITVVITLFLIASIAFLLASDSSISANTSNRELETTRAEYLAQAGLQHALWRTANNACMGDLAIPDTQLGADSYSATVSGAAVGTLYTLSADQDAWIRSDDVTRNNGTTVSNHIRQESGAIEQVLTRFNVSTIPAGAKINSAIAWFHIKALKPHPEGPINVHEITADWTETAVTWESFAASYRGGRVAMAPAQDAGDVWVAINLTGLVQSWVNGQPNYGILFDTQAEGIHTEYTAREDGSNPPRLEVVVGSGDASPVSIKARGTLGNGASLILKDKTATTYQPPGTVVLQLGDDPGADAILDSFYPRNYGAADYVQVNEKTGDWVQRPVLRFDVGSIPAGARVESAQLELRMRTVLTPGVASIHRVSRSWVEGTKSGTGAADGATWATYDGVGTWTSEGGDFNAAAVAETAIAATDTWVTWEIGPLVEQWLAGEPNYGLLLKSDGVLEQAEFYSKEETDATLRPKLTIRYACQCGTPCMVLRGKGRIALIGDDWTPDPDDQLKIQLFESWGYDVDFYQDNDSVGIDWSNYDLAYVSETSVSSDITADLKDLSIGVVIEEPNLYDTLQVASGDTGYVGSTIDIVDNSHFITSAFPPGSLPIYTGDMEILTADAPLAGGLQTLGEFSGAAALTATDEGAQITSGTAAGRRVTLPFGQHFAAGFDWTNLNHNGHLLVQRAIDWGMSTADLTTAQTIFLATASPATLGGLTFDDKDLVKYDPAADEATLFFDGSALGLAYDVDAVHVMPNGHIVLSAKDTISIGGVTVENEDLVEYNPVADTGTLLFDGSTRFSSGSTDVSAVHVMDNGHLLLTNEYSATLGGLSFEPNDIVEFDPATNTATLFLDGSSLGLEQWIDAIHLLDNGNILLSTESPGTLGGLAVGKDDLIEYDPGSDTATLFFDGELFANAEDIIAAHVSGSAGGGGGLIAHWKLDETSGTIAVDSEGGHDGTLTNMDLPNDWVAGKLGGALDFDGSNDYLDIAYASSLSITDEMSFTAWVNSSSAGSGYQTIVTSDDDGSGSNYWFGTFDDELVFGFYAPPNGFFQGAYTTGLSLQPGAWYHLGATFDDSSDEVRLYVDGTEFTVEPLAHSPTVVPANITIGRSRYGEYWHGLLDDVRIYDRVLTDAEIAELAEIPAKLPIAHWKLDDGAGSTAIDSVGGHDGTLANGPTWVTAFLRDALMFDNSDDYVDLTSDEPLNDLFDGGATAMAWIYPNGWGESGYGRVLDKSSSAASTGNGWVLRMNKDNGGIINFGQGFSGGRGWWRVPDGSIALSTWQHIAVAYDAGSASNDPTIYINGTPATVMRIDAPSGSFLSDASINLRLGNFAGGTSQTFDGNIDDVRLYDQMLDAGEIASIAAETGGGGGGSGGGGGGGPGPVFEEFTEIGTPNDATSLNVPIPTGTNSGDLLIAALVTDGDSASSFSPPAGWTLVNKGMNSSGKVSLGVWWKIASASEPADARFTWSGREKAYGWMMRYTGHDPASPVLFDNGALNNDRTAGPICQRLITPVDNMLVLRLGGFDDDDINTGNPGLDGHTAINMGESGGTNGNVSGGSGYMIQSTAGDSDLAWFELTGVEEMRTVTLGIRPE